MTSTSTPEHWIVSWFYVQEADEGGRYAQVSGPAHTEDHRDVYRRCIAVHFASARAVDPEARLVLYLNRPWDPAATPVSGEVDALLDTLGVERRVISYGFAPPAEWTAWRNQFFVFDVLRDLHAAMGADDAVVVLDSDIVWNGGGDPRMLWKRLDTTGFLGLDIGYSTDHVINGLRRTDLADLVASWQDGRQIAPPPYYGGEFIALRRDVLGDVVAAAERWWPDFVADGIARGRFGEEAHLYSAIVAHLGLEGDATGLVKRVWTQVLKYRNVEPADLDLLLWHVPAEMKYGIRRLYRALTRRPEVVFEPAAIGIPRNSARKVVLDLLSVSLARVRTALGRLGRRSAR